MTKLSARTNQRIKPTVCDPKVIKQTNLDSKLYIPIAILGCGQTLEVPLQEFLKTIQTK